MLIDKDGAHVKLSQRNPSVNTCFLQCPQFNIAVALFVPETRTDHAPRTFQRQYRHRRNGSTN